MTLLALGKLLGSIRKRSASASLLFTIWLCSTVTYAQTVPTVTLVRHAGSARPTAPMTEQHIALLFAGQGSADRILVTLNNNRADALTVTL